MKNLVILGGGYGGMRVLARLLPNQLPEDMSITLIDRLPYHCLKTEYYALAAGAVSEQDIRVAFPEHPRLNIIYAEVEKLEQDPNLDIIEYGCLSYCGKCNHSLYALVNGEVVTGETHEQLVDHIYQFLEENPLF